jgi:hypothetical protein
MTGRGEIQDGETCGCWIQADEREIHDSEIEEGITAYAKMGGSPRSPPPSPESSFDVSHSHQQATLGHNQRDSE